MPTAANVSAGKPNVTGAIFYAPIGTELPTTAAETLDASFVELGYASEDGITNTNSAESDSIKAWGGDTVLTLQTSKEDAFKLKLIECENIETLKAIYGSDNVSGEIETGLSINVNNSEPEHGSWVFDMLLSGGVLKRIVVPDAVITEMGDIVYKEDEPVGYEITISAVADNSSNTHYEYFYKASDSE